METKQFFFKGKEFIITLNGMGEGSTIEVIYPNNSNKHIYKLGHEVRMNEIAKYVYVTYEEQILDITGNYLKGGMFEFPATTQETFGYFYNMKIGTATIGTTLTKMVIDGFLIDKFGVPYGVFGNDGEFYYPIDFIYIAESNTITIDIQDKLIDEVYNYTIINTGESNTSGIFTDLPEGDYTIMVESINSMPCIQVVTL